MRIGRLAPFLGLTLALTACGANSDEDGGYGGSSAGSGGTSGQDGGTGATGGTTAGSGGSGGSFDANVPLEDATDWDSYVKPDGDTCEAQSHEAEPYPLDMYVMMDQSGSMSSDIGISGKTKWEAAVDAFTSFLNNTPQQGLSMGIQFFPLPITPWSQMPTCDPNAPACGDDVCVTVDTGPLLSRCLHDGRGVSGGFGVSRQQPRVLQQRQLRRGLYTRRRRWRSRSYPGSTHRSSAPCKRTVR